MHIRLTMLMPAVLAMFGAADARAAFVNGVEEFNGAVLDGASWEAFSYEPGPLPIQQNDALTIDATTYGNYFDYTTRTQTVKVGQKVSVAVTVHNYAPVDQYSYMRIFLTTNSAGTTLTTVHDDYWLALMMDHDSGTVTTNSVNAMYGNYNRAFGCGRLSAYQPVDTTWTWEIERSTSNSASFSVFDAAGDLVGSCTGDLNGKPNYPYAPHPDPLYISFYAQYLSVSFDHVVISPVPEPSFLSLLLTGASLLVRRRSCGAIRA